MCNDCVYSVYIIYCEIYLFLYVIFVHCNMFCTIIFPLHIFSWQWGSLFSINSHLWHNIVNAVWRLLFSIFDWFPIDIIALIKTRLWYLHVCIVVISKIHLSIYVVIERQTINLVDIKNYKIVMWPPLLLGKLFEAFLVFHVGLLKSIHSLKLVLIQDWISWCI